MKNFVILGAGTGGTIMANKLASTLNLNEWTITIVDQSQIHYYQPGFLFIPFGIYKEKDVVKPISNYLPKTVNRIVSAIEKVNTAENTVILSNNLTLKYDMLLISTGVDIRPDQTPGMKDKLWQTSIFDFYTIDGCLKMAEYLKNWKGGKMVINIAEMPIKCPIAPLEFAFLADSYFTKKKMRDKVEIIYATPLSGAFTKPKASAFLGKLLSDKGINVIPDFNIESVDNEKKTINSYDGREQEFDMLVTIPLHMGADYIAASGIGDELNFIPTDKHTLRSKNFDNIYVIGDTTDIPASKAGSVIHFAAEIAHENIMSQINGEELKASFDGHANCFIETGNGKATLIDFNYTTEPLPGVFPLSVIGPLGLLKVNRMNHWGKLAFRWIYWNILLKARDIPFVPSHMKMNGKKSD